jgi:hypothetical protein
MAPIMKNGWQRGHRHGILPILIKKTRTSVQGRKEEEDALARYIHPPLIQAETVDCRQQSHPEWIRLKSARGMKNDIMVSRSFFRVDSKVGAKTKQHHLSIQQYTMTCHSSHLRYQFFMRNCEAYFSRCHLIIQGKVK